MDETSLNRHAAGTIGRYHACDQSVTPPLESAGTDPTALSGHFQDPAWKKGYANKA